MNFQIQTTLLPKTKKTATLLHSDVIRPLQINSLFPVHCLHLVTVSSKYSIILYSSIIFRLFLHTDKLSKSILKQCKLTCQQCYQVGTNLRKERAKHYFMQLFMVVPDKKWLEKLQPYNEIMEMDHPPACKYA